jgi:hypothetical protein
VASLHGAPVSIMPDLQEYSDRIGDRLQRLTRWQRRVLLASAVGACLFVGWHFSKDAYTLVNRSGATIVAGTVWAGGHQFDVGRLASGQRVTFRYWSENTTPLRLRAVFGDQSVVTDSLGPGLRPLLGGRTTTIIEPGKRVVVTTGW